MGRIAFASERVCQEKRKATKAARNLIVQSLTSHLKGSGNSYSQSNIPRKTPGCHAKVTFPEKWNINSDNHWSTESTMVEYLDKVIIPYVSSTRQELDMERGSPR